MLGIVKFFDTNRGYGFLLAANSKDEDRQDLTKDLFFHVRDITTEGYTPKTGDLVSYDVGRCTSRVGRKNPDSRAGNNVQLVKLAKDLLKESEGKKSESIHLVPEAS